MFVLIKVYVCLSVHKLIYSAFIFACPNKYTCTHVVEWQSFVPMHFAKPQTQLHKQHAYSSSPTIRVHFPSGGGLCGVGGDVCICVDLCVCVCVCVYLCVRARACVCEEGGFSGICVVAVAL